MRARARTHTRTHARTHTQTRINWITVVVVLIDEGQRRMYECMNDKTADKELKATIL